MQLLFANPGKAEMIPALTAPVEDLDNPGQGAQFIQNSEGRSLSLSGYLVPTSPSLWEEFQSAKTHTPHWLPTVATVTSLLIL